MQERLRNKKKKAVEQKLGEMSGNAEASPRNDDRHQSHQSIDRNHLSVDRHRSVDLYSRSTVIDPNRHMSSISRNFNQSMLNSTVNEQDVRKNLRGMSSVQVRDLKDHMEAKGTMIAV